MTNRFNIPDISFFERAPEKILGDMLFHISEMTGIELQRADPRRKFVEGLAMFVALERNRAEHELKQNLLAYGEGESLDHKAVDVSTRRLEATPSNTTVLFELEPERPVALVVPEGTRALVGDTYFATKVTVIVPVGEHAPQIDMLCTELGDIGNGYLPGEISSLVDPLPYVKSIRNVTETSGGADEESDDAFAERIRLAPEKFSVAGPELAYKYYALSSSQDIADIEVVSPSPGVTQIVALLKEGRLPTEEHLNKILEICSAEDVRPLTDHVIASAPEVIEYDMQIEYWISSSKATSAGRIIENTELAYAEYLMWQKSKLGRDVNASEAIVMLKEAGASRVRIIGEQYIEVSKTQIAKERNVALLFKGLADD